MIRMLATDLDGTLLRPDLSVGPRTVTALAAARDAGFPVVFATGRPPRWMSPVVEATGHGGVAVCANGALLVDLDAGEVVAAHPIPRPTLVTVAAALRAVLPGTAFVLEYVPQDPLGSPLEAGLDGPTRLARMRAYGHEEGYLPRDDPRYGPLVAPLEELATLGPAVKLLARAPRGYDPDAVLAAGRAAAGPQVEVTHSAKAVPLLEISAVGVCKATGLADYAARLSISRHEVATVGDMPNDISMLAWAGRSYAVERSHPDALAAATGRVAAAVEDGVAALLEQLLAQPGALAGGLPGAAPVGRPAGSAAVP